MKLYSSDENYKLYQGNMLDMLEVIDKELMELLGETIDNYDMQLLGHKIIVAVTKHLEGE